MTTGGMLHAKLPRGSPLRDLMYSSAEPTLVCRVVSPRVLYRTVVSDSDGRKRKRIEDPGNTRNVEHHSGCSIPLQKPLAVGKV